MHMHTHKNVHTLIQYGAHGHSSQPWANMGWAETRTAQELSAAKEAEFLLSQERESAGFLLVIN